MSIQKLYIANVTKQTHRFWHYIDNDTDVAAPLAPPPKG